MNTLKAEKRNMQTKAKKLRREGYVTGNVFGREIEGSIPVQMTQKEAEKFLKANGKGSQIMLDLDGEQMDVLVKEVDYDSMGSKVLEIDFQALVSGEMVHSVAEVVIHNQSKVVTGVVEELLDEIEYKALPSALVEKVIVDVGDLKVGETIKVKDLDIAKDKDVKLITDPEADVAGVAAVHNDVPETDEEEAAALTAEINNADNSIAQLVQQAEEEKAAREAAQAQAEAEAAAAQEQDACNNRI